MQLFPPTSDGSTNNMPLIIGFLVPTLPDLFRWSISERRWWPNLQMRNPFQAQEVTLKQTIAGMFRHTMMNPSEAMGLTIILTFSVLTFWLLVGTRRVVEKTTVEIFEDNVKILKLSQETLEFGQKTLKFSQETLRFSQETLESSHETKRSFVAAIQRMNATLGSLEKHVAVTERAMGEFREAGMALEARLAGVEVRTEYLDGAVPEC